MTEHNHEAELARVYGEILIGIERQMGKLLHLESMMGMRLTHLEETQAQQGEMLRSLEMDRAKAVFGLGLIGTFCAMVGGLAWSMIDKLWGVS